jgi:hypothetical protein
MSLLHKLERRLQPLALPHVLLAIVAGQTFFYIAAMLEAVNLDRLVLVWDRVADGEWWRLTSFALMPPASHWALVAFALYMVYFLGDTLEKEWGTLRLNLFLLTGWILTVAASWLAPGAVMGNGFIGGSVFLAFAYLNPNFTFYIFFILPVRVKWLALITWVFYAYTVAFGGPVPRLAVLASTGNFLIFFGARIVADLRSGKRHMEGQRRRVAERREAEAAGPRHRCVTCAKNSDTHPDEDFRYTADDRCFCSEHLPRRVPGP